MTTPKPTVDLGYPTEAHGRIPAFNSIEEEAEFWDTHDTMEFPDEFKPVEMTIGTELAEKLTLRLDRADREALVQRARVLGVGPSTLARMWIREHLRVEGDMKLS